MATTKISNAELNMAALGDSIYFNVGNIAPGSISISNPCGEITGDHPLFQPLPKEAAMQFPVDPEEEKIVASTTGQEVEKAIAAMEDQFDAATKEEIAVLEKQKAQQQKLKDNKAKGTEPKKKYITVPVELVSYPKPWDVPANPYQMASKEEPVVATLLTVNGFKKSMIVNYPYPPEISVVFGHSISNYYMDDKMPMMQSTVVSFKRIGTDIDGTLLYREY